MSHDLIIIDNITVDVGHEDLKVTCKSKPCSRLSALQVIGIVWRYLRSS